jgi:AsmA protein
VAGVLLVIKKKYAVIVDRSVEVDDNACIVCETSWPSRAIHLFEGAAMKRVLTYSLFGLIALVLIGVATVLIVPHFFDVNRYKPTIERLISENIGMPAHLNGDITLSLFPWIALSFNDLQVDSPAGSGTQSLLQIRSFEARLKTMPLLSKNIEISTFVIDGPRISLEKNVQGRWNWQKPETTEPSPPAPTPSVDSPEQPTGGQPAGPQAPDGFTLNSLHVAEFSIRDGNIVVTDQAAKAVHELSGITLQLTDVSLDRPITVALEAALDQQPLTVTGSIGPLGTDPGTGSLPVDLTVIAFNTVTAQIAGTLSDLKDEPAYRFDLSVEPFSLRQLVSLIKPGTPLQTADPKALEHIALRGRMSGTAQQIELTDTTITIDDTAVSLDRALTEFAGPRIDLALSVDSIDLDRYLPPPATGQPAEDNEQTKDRTEQPAAVARQEAGTPAEQSSVETTGGATVTSPATAEQPAGGDYEALRSLVLTAAVKLNQAVFHGATATNIVVQLSGENALFTLNSLALDLYQGYLTATGSVNLGREIPVSTATVAVEAVQVGPLLRDFADKDLLEGSLAAQFDLSASGDRSAAITSSLNGAGTLLFSDGALIGLDLARMARTITSGFSLEQQGERPRTDFSEMNLPFTITNGLITVPEATLRSPFIRAGGRGTVNLVTKSLDLRLRPELVATIKGQGDEEQRSGLAVPVVVGGTFSEPTFQPDLEALAREQLLNRQDVQDFIKDGTITPERKERLSKEVEKAKGLLKGILGN